MPPARIDACSSALFRLERSAYRSAILLDGLGLPFWEVMDVAPRLKFTGRTVAQELRERLGPKASMSKTSTGVLIFTRRPLIPGSGFACSTAATARRRISIGLTELAEIAAALKATRLALRDISLRCAIWSLSGGHSGRWQADRPADLWVHGLSTERKRKLTPPGSCLAALADLPLTRRGEMADHSCCAVAR